MNLRAILTSCALLTGACAQHNPAAAVEHLITTDSIAGAVRYLADDLLEGRGVGTRGDRLTRKYIATQFEMFGLKPGGADGSRPCTPLRSSLPRTPLPLGSLGSRGA